MINLHDKNITDLYQKILSQGSRKGDRTGVGTQSIFGYQMRFDLQQGFPLFTLRKIHTKSLIHELLWFLEAYDDTYKKFGNTNIRYLLDHGVTFWTEWPYKEYRRQMLDKYLAKDLVDENTIPTMKLLSVKEFETKIRQDDNFALEFGDLGPVYGHQWKHWGEYHLKVEMTKEYSQSRNGIKLVNSEGWREVRMPGIDQIEQIIRQLREEPDSRRIIVNAWNVSDIDDAMLPPCHAFFQLYTDLLSPDEQKLHPGKTRKVSLQMYQRSCDSYLGLCFNVPSYSLLLHMIAQVVNMVPAEFIWTGGDTHLYTNSLAATQEVLQRESFAPCQLILNSDIKKMTDFRFEDIKIENYQAHPNIQVDVAV
jgi:thymidylate synthase